VFEIIRPEETLVARLASFFLRLEAAGVSRHFHPHPLNWEEAERRCRYEGLDEYLVAIHDDQIVGYAFLRGWDEGYAVPALGVVVDPAFQGLGLGRHLMHCLHTLARERKATRIILKVYPENEKALGLYRSLGYVFGAKEKNQLIGVLDLEKQRHG
jgi:ribosomal protein S18 acetylase RimI-like enzyme